MFTKHPLFTKLLRYAVLVLAFIGLILSLIAPGWALALIFAALFAYLWKFASQFAPLPYRTTPRTEFQQKRRSEPDTYRSIEWKGMIFRSQTEVRIAKTLDHRGIFFIPPTRVRLSAGKGDRQSRELDFVICHEGKWGVLEVDGPFHDAKLDAERDKLLRAHGIRSIQRFSADRCYQTPHAVIDQFLHVLDME